MAVEHLGEIATDVVEIEVVALAGGGGIHVLRREHQEHVALDDRVTYGHSELLHLAGHLGRDDVLHLHGLHHGQQLAGVDQVARRDGQLDHRALERGDHGEVTVGQVRRRWSDGRSGGGGLAEVEHGERVVGVEPGTGQAGVAGGGGVAGPADVAGVGHTAGLRCIAGLDDVRDLGKELVEVLVDEPCGDAARRDVGVRDQCREQAGVGGHALDAELAERPPRPLERRLQGVTPRDDLGDEGVEAGVDGAARPGRRVDPHTGPGRRVEDGDRAGRGQHRAVGPQRLGVDPHLDGRAVRRWRRPVPREAELGEGLATRQAQLGLHDVDAGHRLGHGVLHLEPGVGLEERDPTVGVDEQLDRAGVLVAHGATECDRGIEEALPRGGAQVRGGRDLDQLLVAALQAALPLPQVGDLRPVAEDLHLHVPGTGEELLHVDVAPTEGGGRLGPAALDRRHQLVGTGRHAHAASATAGDGLHHHGGAGAEALEERQRIVGRGGLGAGQHRDALGGREPAGRGLVAEDGEHLRRGPDEHQAGGLAPLGEGGALRQEAVAGVDGVTARRDGHLDELVGVEVGGRAAAAQGDRLVGPTGVEGAGIVVGEHRKGRHVELGGGTGDADGDLATVGDQDSTDRHVPDPRFGKPRPPIRYRIGDARPTHPVRESPIAHAATSDSQTRTAAWSPRGGLRPGRGSRRGRRSRRVTRWPA